MKFILVSRVPVEKGGGTWYWCGRKKRWSLWREHAYEYQNARQAAKALRKGKKFKGSKSLPWMDQWVHAEMESAGAIYI